MKTISIDIDTYSGVDLTKCGVYKYAESPDFEILLFTYSVDGGEVSVVDLTSVETIPPEIIDALTDDDVQKWAFNANFERVCLSRYLSEMGVPLDPFADNRFSSQYLGKANTGIRNHGVVPWSGRLTWACRSPLRALGLFGDWRSRS